MSSSLTCARILRSRWEEEKPFWFTKKWKARIPKQMLKRVESASKRRDDTDEDEEIIFCAAIGEAPPWNPPPPWPRAVE